VAWTFRESLLDTPGTRGFLVRIGVLEDRRPAPVSDPGSMQLVSRDMHVHAERAGILVLSATFVNRSETALAWPRLELKLLDARGSPLAWRRFEPAEYLGRDPGAADLLQPGTHVPIRLEFAAPRDRATGFELQFR
jgi:hypothetical protein